MQGAHPRTCGHHKLVRIRTRGSTTSIARKLSWRLAWGPGYRVLKAVKVAFQL